MKKVVYIILISSSLLVQAKEDKKKAVCCPGVSWQTKQECRDDEGNYILDDKCCENSFLGKKDNPDQVCCGACTEDAIEPGVD